MLEEFTTLAITPLPSVGLAATKNDPRGTGQPVAGAGNVSRRHVAPASAVLYTYGPGATASSQPFRWSVKLTANACTDGTATGPRSSHVTPPSVVRSSTVEPRPVETAPNPSSQ